MPGGSAVKNPLADSGDTGLISGSRRSLEKEMATHSGILAGKSHGHRSLVGFSPWGRKRIRHNCATEHHHHHHHHQDENSLFSRPHQNSSHSRLHLCVWFSAQGCRECILTFSTAWTQAQLHIQTCSTGNCSEPSVYLEGVIVLPQVS